MTVLPSIRELLSSIGPTDLPQSLQPQQQQQDAATYSKQRPGRKVSSSADAGARSYRCGVHSCAASFKRPEHLKRHMLTHTQRRPFRCSGCGKRFSRRDNYATHRKKHADTHEDECVADGSLSSCASSTGESEASGGVLSINSLLNDENDDGFDQNLESAERCNGNCGSSEMACVPVPAQPVSSVQPALPSQQIQPSQHPRQLPPAQHASQPLQVTRAPSISAVPMFIIPSLELLAYASSAQCKDPTRPTTYKNVVHPLPSSASESAAKPFSCHICNARFGRLEHVKRHHLVHTNEKPFSCPECNKTFARKDNMVQHRRAHQRKRRFKK